LLTYRVEFRAFTRIKKWSGPIGKVVPNDQTRTTGAIELFRALDQMGES
jgi:hypothetical protein